MGQGGGRNNQVVGANGRAAIEQLCAYACVMCSGGIVERDTLQGCEEDFETLQVQLHALAAQCTTQQLCLDQAAQHGVLRIVTVETVNQVALAAIEQLYADVGIEQINHSSGNLCSNSPCGARSSSAPSIGTKRS